MLLAALAYFVLPFDVVPDMVPVLGFTDDLTVLMIAVGLVQRPYAPGAPAPGARGAGAAAPGAAGARELRLQAQAGEMRAVAGTRLAMRCGLAAQARVRAGRRCGHAGLAGRRRAGRPRCG
jgi:hypothetical protein